MITIFYFFYELNIQTVAIIILISSITISLEIRIEIFKFRTYFQNLFIYKYSIFGLFKKYYLFILLIPFFIYYLIMLSLPEITWDALAYHLPLMPNRKISFSNNFSFYNALPKGLDVLFWFGYILSKDYFLPKFFHFIFLFILLIFVSNLSNNYRFKSIWILPVIFLLNHWISLEYAASCYIDFGNSTLEILALYFLYLFWIRKDIFYLIWMINFLLFAVSIKYTSLATSFILVFLSLFIIFKERIRLKEFKFKDLNSLFLFSLLPLLYYGKNLLYLKNPFWPFYFGHQGMSELDYFQLTISNLNSFTFTKTLSSYFLLPLRIFSGNFEAYKLETFNDLIENVNYQSIELGVFFIFITFLLFKQILYKKLFILGLLFLFLTFSFNFLFGSHQTRYILSSFLILSIFPSLFLSSSYLSKYKYVKHGIILLLIFFIYQNQFNKIKSILSYFSSNGNIEYLKNIHDYEPAIFMNQRGISTKNTVYPFQLNGLRYYQDYQNLSDSYSLDLGLTDDIQADLAILRNNSKNYWITNKLTTSWRKDWLKDSYYTDKIRLYNLIQLDEYIIKNGIILERTDGNFLIKIP
ncbi:MAG: hypothetical protein MH321_13550 [Leptospiraceae bacterium]|nr:hypothetical protein [Leptospiraceae bacterium]